MKKCPRCAEDIQYEAKICKHCGKDVSLAGRIDQVGSTLQAIGCLLTIFITIPILILLLLK